MTIDIWESQCSQWFQCLQRLTWKGRKEGRKEGCTTSFVTATVSVTIAGPHPGMNWFPPKKELRVHNSIIKGLIELILQLSTPESVALYKYTYVVYVKIAIWWVLSIQVIRSRMFYKGHHCNGTTGPPGYSHSAGQWKKCHCNSIHCTLNRVWTKYEFEIIGWTKFEHNVNRALLTA